MSIVGWAFILFKIYDDSIAISLCDNTLIEEREVSYVKIKTLCNFGGRISPSRSHLGNHKKNSVKRVNCFHIIFS